MLTKGERDGRLIKLSRWVTAGIRESKALWKTFLKKKKKALDKAKTTWYTNQVAAREGNLEADKLNKEPQKKFEKNEKSSWQTKRDVVE